MKEMNMPIKGKFRLNNQTITSQKYTLIIRGILLPLLLLPLFVIGKSNSPMENVKLTGRSYNYPIGLEGTPYLFDDWKIGNLLLENGKVAGGVKVKVNIINNDLVFYNEELKRVFTIDKETIKNFTIKLGTEDSLFFIKY